MYRVAVVVVLVSAPEPKRKLEALSFFSSLRGTKQSRAALQVTKRLLRTSQ